MRIWLIFMKIKYILLGLLIGVTFNSSGYCEFAAPSSDKKIDPVMLDQFIEHKAEKIKKEQEKHLEKYPWTKDPKFQDSPNLIYKIILQSKIEGKDYTPTNSDLAKDGSQENFILAEKVILKMENENITSEKAIEEASKETYNKERITDIGLYTKAANADKLVKDLDAATLKKELEEFSKTKAVAPETKTDSSQEKSETSETHETLENKKISEQKQEASTKDEKSVSSEPKLTEPKLDSQIASSETESTLKKLATPETSESLKKENTPDVKQDNSLTVENHIKSEKKADKPELDIKTIDYRKPINMMNLSVKYDIPGMDAKSKNRALYGIWSTCENYKSGYYKNLNGDAFPLQRTERAKNPWEILGISPTRGNPNALWSAIESKLSSIAPKYKTEIIDSTETYQDLILKYSSNGEKVVAVNFSNNDIVGFGAMSGIVSKWNVLFHICTGLYDSVLMNVPQSTPGKVTKYTSPLHSPESTLYSQNVSLIKVWNQGKFCALQKPTNLSVIHSSLKDVNLNNPNFEKILEQKAMMQIVIAILTGNDVLLTDQTLFGSQKSATVKNIFAKILENPLIKGKIKTVVFSGKIPENTPKA